MTYFHLLLPYCSLYDENEAVTEIIYVYYLAGWQINILEEIAIYDLSFRIILMFLLVKILKVKFQYLGMSKFISQLMALVIIFRFYARDSGLLKFKIHAGIVGSKSPPPSARRLVAFTFHPFEPFAISVQRTNAEYVVNFHIRHIS